MQGSPKRRKSAIKQISDADLSRNSDGTYIDAEDQTNFAYLYEYSSKFKNVEYEDPKDENPARLRSKSEADASESPRTRSPNKSPQRRQSRSIANALMEADSPTKQSRVRDIKARSLRIKSTERIERFNEGLATIDLAKRDIVPTGGSSPITALEGDRDVTLQSSLDKMGRKMNALRQSQQQRQEKSPLNRSPNKSRDQSPEKVFQSEI
jgi:hypothetical protein